MSPRSALAVADDRLRRVGGDRHLAHLPALDYAVASHCLALVDGAAQHRKKIEVLHHHHFLLVAIYVDSLNEVIDLHTERIIAAGARLQLALWRAIYAIALLSMVLVGLQNGVLGNRSLLAIVVLALVFAAVLQLITDLDRPQEGVLTVSQQALIDLQRQLRGGP